MTLRLRTPTPCDRIFNRGERGINTETVLNMVGRVDASDDAQGRAAGATDGGYAPSPLTSLPTRASKLQ